MSQKRILCHMFYYMQVLMTNDSRSKFEIPDIQSYFITITILSSYLLRPIHYTAITEVSVYGRDLDTSK